MKIVRKNLTKKLLLLLAFLSLPISQAFVGQLSFNPPSISSSYGEYALITSGIGLALASKLASQSFQEQLLEVDALLETDPENGHLIKLKTSIQQMAYATSICKNVTLAAGTLGITLLALKA